MKTIDLEQIAAITGGINWEHSRQQSVNYSHEAVRYGAVGGGVLGLVAGGVPGGMLGATAGAIVGGVAGAAYGFGRGVIETWKE